jgi:nitrogen fixation NifU-like protein
MDHFENPRNLGDVPDGARARCVNPACGDEAELSVRVSEGVIEDIRFRAMGCVAALAACSVLTEMVRSQPVERALEITVEKVVEELGGLPRSKRHGAALAVDTLKKLLEGTP